MVNTEFLNRTLVFSTQNGTKPGEALRCYLAKTVNNNGVWQDINPLAQSLPLFLIQLILITSITKLLLILLKPLRLPPIVAELIAAVIMGNTGLNRFRKRVDFLAATFSISRVVLVETLGNLGLMYYLFLLGLEMDLSPIPQMGKKVFSIAIAGALFPFLMGMVLYRYCVPGYKIFNKGYLFWGVSLTVTGLPVLADILARLKLLHSDLGRTAMSAALINDIISWVLLAVVLAGTTTHGAAPFSLLCTILFILFCYYVVRPKVLSMISRTREGEEYSETTICIILMGVLACGLVTDFLGTSSIVGAFVFGLVIPNHALGHRFLVVLQGFVTDLLMPVYFTLSGFRFIADVLILNGPSLWVLCGGIFLVCISKLVTIFVVACFIDMPFHEGVSLGLLMNTKGLLAIMALNFGYDHLVIDDVGYAIMFLSVLLMTFATSPIMHFLYKPVRRFQPNKHRALQKLKTDAELRVLACIHEMQTVSGITKLLMASHPSRHSPICVFALQLIQLTRNTTALLIIHSPTRFGSSNSRNRADGQTEHIIAAFQKLERECNGLSVHPLTAMSPYDTMHEDICNVAEDKRVNLIILPFHKRQTVHDTLEDSNPEYKGVNENVWANAPCSVGLLMDRGLGTRHPANSGQNLNVPLHIAMIFIGGPDDREALALAWRMAGDPNATLEVLRLIPGKDEIELERLDVVEENGVIFMEVEEDLEKQLDDSFIIDFKYKTSGKKSVAYSERMVRDGAETVGIIRSMGEDFDIYVVGRSLGMLSPLTAGLEDWSECPELGAIGDLVLTSDFSSQASLLVVQQYVGLRPAGDGVATPVSSEDYRDIVGHRML